MAIDVRTPGFCFRAPIIHELSKHRLLARSSGDNSLYDRIIHVVSIVTLDSKRKIEITLQGQVKSTRGRPATGGIRVGINSNSGTICVLFVGS